VGDRIAKAHAGGICLSSWFLLRRVYLSGIAAALILSRVLRSFLFDVEPTDPITLIGVGLLFTAVAMLACWAPTRRAAKVEPLEALRYE
jgi:putative ABC transport system permease protein